MQMKSPLRGWSLCSLDAAVWTRDLNKQVFSAFGQMISIRMLRQYSD